MNIQKSLVVGHKLHSAIYGAANEVEDVEGEMWTLCVHNHYKEARVSVFKDDDTATFSITEEGITLIEAEGDVTGATAFVERVLRVGLSD